MRIATTLALALPLLAGCLAPKDFKGKKNPDFHVIGHRGAPQVAAENTIASMRAAAEAGANAVEIDLVQTADGQVVLWHDLDPDDPVAEARQIGLEGLLYLPSVPEEGSPDRRRVDELTLEELRATHGYTRTRGGEPDPEAPIATWEELVEWLRGEPRILALYVDVKVDQPDQARAITRVVQASTASGGRLGTVEVFFLSPRRAIVEAMLAELEAVGERDMAVMWDFEEEGALRGAEELGLAHVSTGLTVSRTEDGFLDEVEGLLEARQDRRIDSVVVWTIDRRMQLGILLYYGVDGIMTNEPALLADMWQRTL